MMLVTEEKSYVFSNIGCENMGAWLLALAPILGIYKFGPVNASIGDVCLLLLLMFLMLRIVTTKKLIFRYIPFFMGFVIFLFLSSLFSLFFQTSPDFNDFIGKWIKLLTYYTLINLLINYKIDKNLVITLTVNVSVLLSIILIFQWLALHIFNQIVFPYLPYPPLYYNIGFDELYQQTLSWVSMGLWRPSSIFAEPASYAEYCILGAILLFFEQSGFSKIVLIKRIIICIGILFSGSATGFFLLAGVFLIWYFNKMQTKLNILTLIGFLSVIILAFFIIQSDFFSDAMSRLMSFNLAGGSSTANLRVLQGFIIYDQLPDINKIFGVGFGNLKNYLIQHSIVTSFLTDVGNEGMSAIGTILNTSGFVGLFLYCFSFLRVWRLTQSLSSHVIIFVLFSMFFTSNIFFTSLFVTYFSFLCMDICARNNI